MTLKKILIICIIFCFQFSNARNDKYRLIIRDNPATSIVIGWNQISGDNATIYYGKTDFKTDYSNYEHSQKVDRKILFRGMNNQFARLTKLSPNTAYYFVIKDNEGVSERFWFRTSSNNNSPVSFIAGGDSRNNRIPRQNANKLVAKLKPNAVLFGGDMTSSDTDIQWQEWFDDWQLTTASDNRMFPIIAARGNHERENNSIYNLFDTPSERIYYAVTFGDNLVRTYTLNTEIAIDGGQTNWLKNDLNAQTKVIWKMVQYHKPMRPHVSRKREGNMQYQHWANLFYKNDVKLVVECDAHTVKSTWPIVPSTKKRSSEGFLRNDKKGTVYVGEGCWGAPLRKNDDNKPWTRDSGKFNQFKWIFVTKNKIEIRTINTKNADNVDELTNNNSFDIPKHLNIWNPKNGAVIEILK